MYVMGSLLSSRRALEQIPSTVPTALCFPPDSEMASFIQIHGIKERSIAFEKRMLVCMEYRAVKDVTDEENIESKPSRKKKGRAKQDKNRTKNGEKKTNETKSTRKGQ